MSATRILRYAAASILLLNGVIHLALAVVTGSDVLVLAIFGAIYVAVAAGLFWGKRVFTYLGIILPIVGIFIATYGYTINSQMILLVLIGMDASLLVPLLAVASNKLD